MKSQLYQTHEGRLIAFAALKNELCRNPSGREMMERYPNIEKPYNGRYRNYWQKWEFDKAFDDLMTKLEIVPTEEDINIFISGAVFYFNDLSGKRENRGHYDLLDYLADRGLGPNRDERDKLRVRLKEINDIFSEMERKLGKQPSSEEFEKAHKREYGFILYSLGNWTNYLATLGRKTLRTFRYWDVKTVDKAYDALEEDLRRTPTFTEFKIKNPGAISRITSGKYDSSIKSWRDYLVYRGKNPIEKRHSLNLLESILEDPETGGLP